MKVHFVNKGTFSNFENYIKRIRRISRTNEQLEDIAKYCVKELAEATPKDTGLTAKSWSYEIQNTGKTSSIVFYNTNIQNGVNVAILLDFGHATPNGKWVEGKNYIDPIIQEQYLNIVNNKWKGMTKL